MKSQKFVIHISGPSCSGKSTIGNLVAAKFPGIYTVSYDKLKWLLSGYDRDKHRPLIKDIERGFFEVICQKSIPIELNFFFESEEEYLRVKSTAEKYGYKLISVELTAPADVLLNRFKGRLKEAKQKGAKISVTDESTFLEIISQKSYVPKDTNVFDTSMMQASDIADKIYELVSELAPN